MLESAACADVWQVKGDHFLFLVLSFLATLPSIRDVSSPTKDRTCALCGGNVET